MSQPFRHLRRHLPFKREGTLTRFYSEEIHMSSPPFQGGVRGGFYGSRYLE